MPQKAHGCATGFWCTAVEKSLEKLFQVLFLGHLSIQVSGEKGQIIHHCRQLPQKQLKSGHVLEVILQEAKIAEWENVKN